jgi:hypothetical protein
MKESDKNRAIVAEVIARGWREPAYMSQLRQNPKSVLQQAGASIPANTEVVLLENSPTVINAILPAMGDMAKYESRIQKAVQMLKDLPEDMEVHLHRDSATRAFIVVPERPSDGGELTDAQLEHVVGGKGGSHKPPPPPPPPAVGVVSVSNAVNATNVASVAEGVTGAVAVEEAAAVTTAVGVAEVAGAVAAVVVPCFIS